MKLADFFVQETEPTQPEHSLVVKKRRNQSKVSSSSV